MGQSKKCIAKRQKCQRNGDSNLLQQNSFQFIPTWTLKKHTSLLEASGGERKLKLNLHIPDVNIWSFLPPAAKGRLPTEMVLPRAISSSHGPVTADCKLSLPQI